jgi:hypothetical protein
MLEHAEQQRQNLRAKHQKKRKITRTEVGRNVEQIGNKNEEGVRSVKEEKQFA